MSAKKFESAPFSTVLFELEIDPNGTDEQIEERLDEVRLQIGELLHAVIDRIDQKVAEMSGKSEASRRRITLKLLMEVQSLLHPEPLSAEDSSSKPAPKKTKKK